MSDKVLEQKTKKTLTRYMQILFVALAFGLMVVASYYFVSDIENRHLKKNVKDIISHTEESIKTGLIEPEAVLDNLSENIRGMILQGGEEGYGFLLNESLIIIAHPEPKMIGMAFHDANSRIAFYEDKLIQDSYVSEVITTNYNGISSIVFIEKLQNGWYMGVVTPRDKYHQGARNMAFGLTVMGAVLATALIIILLAIFGEINKENDKFQKMAHWYNAILNAIPLPITVTDTEAKWTFINLAVEKFLGITLKTALGKPCSNWGATICNTPDCGIVCAKRGLKQTYFSEGNSSYKVDVAILKDLNKNIMGYIEIVQDITDLKIMAKKQADAEAANFAKSAFLAKISHEIRTPMNAILGITEIQLQNETLSPDMKSALNRIYNSGYLLLGIINDILDLSKIEAGKLELFPIEYDVPSLINDTVSLNVVRYESKPIKFNLHVDENIPSVLLGDELRIKQILNNLLSNAFKYTADGEVTMSVFPEIQREEPGEIKLIFRISDTGQGMTAGQLDRLFEEYMRFNREVNRAVEGVGLGMSITKHLVRLMNGEISVESKPGKGSVFTVRLPQKVSANSSVIGRELAEKTALMSPIRNAHAKKAPIIYEYMPYGKVLIVDDVETNLYVTRGLINPYGLSVQTAESGYEAIEKIKNGETWDIIFMDHFMPGMDGIETVKIIRGMGYTKSIVALTANVITGQAEMFFASGFDDFISKPIDIRQLDIVLNKLIRDKYQAETTETAPQIKDNMEKSSGSPPVSENIKNIFKRDAEKAIDVLETILKKQDNYGNEDIQLYIINVHAMKSALANVGETELSVFANKLESAGRTRNIAVILNQTPVFLSSLRAIIS
ncbi:MAG: response regulator [Treponema sp.]|jgi:signal transduction histidine kinase/DNA-binding NarL/FixJ family response regulator|nr:response regulator [Treponema sp.]